jgi:L-fucose mutarotase
MLRYKLIHPELMRVLAKSGHGNQILLADSNYPVTTHAAEKAERIYLNLAPGLLNATDILKVLLDAINVESATVMLTAEGNLPPITDDFKALLPKEIKIQALERFTFYDAVKQPETTLVIATGEQRIYGNLLLGVGVVK